jgi:hypothetical protein
MVNRKWRMANGECEEISVFTFTIPKKEDTGISARCLPEGRKCAVGAMHIKSNYIYLMAHRSSPSNAL